MRNTKAMLLAVLLLQGCADSTNSNPVLPPVIPPPTPVAQVDPILTWHVGGTLADGGSFSGTLRYNGGEQPKGGNVRGLSPNVIYELAEWDIVVNTSFEPPIHYTNLSAIPETYELCMGQCVFTSQGTQRIFFFDGLHSMQLVFALPIVQHLILPQVQGDWGTVDLTSSDVRSEDAKGFHYLIVMRGASIKG